MSTIKTYNQINEKDKSLSFRISKMENIYENRNGKADTPHKHEYYTMLLTTKADGKHVIDFKSYSLSNNQVFFIKPHQVHQIIENEKSFGFVITFSNHFLVKNNINTCFINDINLFNDFGENPPLTLNDDELEKLTDYAYEMLSFNQSEITFKEDAVGALLKLLLICCHNLCSISPKKIEPEVSENSILKGFKFLVDKNYSTWHSTSNYANELNITPDYLNRVIKSLTGKTAKSHIQDQIILMAKRLIYFTDLSSKEIGYKLGFSEPANFSAFFKNCTGVSPSKFKAPI
ncbi:Transcriptional regulator, AraC family [hydrothermal vent metagenome]|uniref:Transcriptional regulator, AraC family n=1 Tax=hydrothermal vent metagenome TaxID=652676 RepID=A0A3B0QVE3_9ZZZZ